MGVIWDDEEPQGNGRVVWDDEPSAPARRPPRDFLRELNKAGAATIINPVLGLAKGVDAVTAAFGVDKTLAEMAGLDSAEDFVSGVQQGGTLGFADEMEGVVGAGVDKLANAINPTPLADMVTKKDRSLVGAYRENRGAARQEADFAAQRSPIANTAGELAGAVALPVPGTQARAATFLPRLGKAMTTGAGMGATYGLGSGEADLTRGEVLPAMAETAVGAGAGMVGGALGEGAVTLGGKLLGGIRKKAIAGSDDAVAAERAYQEALADKAIRSKQGEYRAGVQSASRDLEVMEREAAALPPGHPLKEQLARFLESPEGMAVREQVAGNKLGTAPERIGEMQNLLGQFQELAAGKEANVAAQTAEALKDPVKKHVLQRAWTLGHRLLPPAMAAVGGVFGGPGGAVAGGAVGVGMSLVQGAPGRIIKNLLAKPAVKKAFWDKVIAATGGRPEQMTPFVRMLEGAAEKGDREFATASFVLAQRHPEVRQILQRVAEFGKDADSEERLAAR